MDNLTGKLKAFPTRVKNKVKDKIKGKSSHLGTLEFDSSATALANDDVSGPDVDSGALATTSIAAAEPVRGTQTTVESPQPLPDVIATGAPPDAAVLGKGVTSPENAAAQSHPPSTLLQPTTTDVSAGDDIMATGDSKNLNPEVLAQSIKATPDAKDSPHVSDSALSPPTSSSTARNVIKTSLNCVGLLLEGLPIPTKEIVGLTLKVIELTEKMQENTDAFQRFANHCSLLKETLATSVEGKNIKQLPEELLESIGQWMEKLSQAFHHLINSRSDKIGGITSADDDTALIDEVNARVQHALQLFCVENHIAGRIALQGIIKSLHNIEKHHLSENIKSLDIAKRAAYNSYMSQRTTCFEGTRASLLNEISKWYTGSGPKSPIYILDGIAGTGKSTVSQTVAKHADSLHLLGASFFFSCNEKELQSAQLFFCTVAFQLACYDKSLALLIGKELEEHPDTIYKDLQSQFNALIFNPLQNLTTNKSSLPILIVIDALDECNAQDAQKLLSILASHISELPQLKVFITCRPEAHIQKLLKENLTKQWCHCYDIDKSIVTNDIHQYLEYSLSPEQVHKVFPGLQPPWTLSTEQFQQLAELSEKLFIVASTAVKFILDKHQQNPLIQLQRLLESTSKKTMAIEPTLVMDKFYAHIMCAAVPCDMDFDPDEDWLDQYQIVMGTILVLQTPLPCEALSGLLGINSNIIKATLANLHSLIGPTSLTNSDDDLTFHMHHQSFADFITNMKRILQALRSSTNQMLAIGREVWIDPAVHHLRMAKRCLTLVSSLPLWNVCKLDRVHWYSNKAEVQSFLPQEMVYACSHFINHLMEVKVEGKIMEDIEAWASTHFLSWLEAICWISGPTTACEHIFRLQKMIPTHYQQVIAILVDGLRMLQKNLSVLVQFSAMHIYWTGLALLPQETALYKTYSQLMQDRPNVVLGTQKLWDQTIAIFLEHADPSLVMSVAFSPDGSKLASGSAKSENSAISLWDVYSGNQVALFQGHLEAITSVAYSTDGTLLSSGSYDKTVRLWNIASGKCLAVLEGHKFTVYSVAFSADEVSLASGSGDSIRVWDRSSFNQITVLESQWSSVKCVAFSCDGSILASGSTDCKIKLWDTKSWAHLATLDGHNGAVTSISFSPDGGTLASGSDDERIKLWDFKARKCLATLKGYTKRVTSVTFSPDGSVIASACVYDEEIHLWDTTQGTHLASLPGHSKDVRSIAFSPAGSILASGSEDKTVRLWNIMPSNSFPYTEGIRNSSQLSVLQPGYSEMICAVAFSLDGHLLASGSSNKLIKLWNIKTGSCLATFKGHSNTVKAVAFSPDVAILASGSDDMTIHLWSPMQGNSLAKLEGHTASVLSLAFSQDSSVLASGSTDCTIRLWNLQLFQCCATLNGHTGPVRSLVFLTNGSRLASGSHDQTIQLWDIKSRSKIVTLGPHAEKLWDISLSPAGSLLAAQWGDNAISIWAMTSNNLKALCTFEGSKYHISLLRHIQITQHYIYGLIRRKKPDMWGLLALKVDNDTISEPLPFMWFPTGTPYVNAFTLLAADGNASQVALGFEDGQIHVIDISKVLLP